MKKIAFILISVTLLVAPVFADAVFFPSKKGMVLTTANYNAKGKLEGYTRMGVKNVTGAAGSGGDGTIVYTVQALDKKMQIDKPKSEAPEYVAPVAGGAVELSMEPWAALSGGKDIKITGTQMFMPSSLAPGDRIKDSNVSMSMTVAVVGEVTAEVATTGQKCTGIETITVPAGTFECHKVERKSVTVANMVGKITLVNNSTVWYARGIGPVKSLTYDEAGKLKGSSELFEIVK
jgi:pectate lyase